MFVLSHHLSVLVFIIGMFTLDEATKHCPPLMTFTLTQDMVLEGHVVATLKVEERHWCEHHCIREPRCRSFNYQIDEAVNPKERICELSSSTIQRHPGLAKKRPGWLYEKVIESNVKQDKDDCSPNPCKNGGTCIDGVDSYKCSCKPGYSGANCEIDINDCYPNRCKNGGTCTDGVDSYKCACKPGLSGKNCETNIDDCSPNPCKNGGNCTDGVESFNCSCKPGFSGKNCETNIDDCSPNPCKNGGNCTDGVDSYNCSCKPEYNGTNCEEIMCSNTSSLGAADGGRIPNSSFSATSEYDHKFNASYGRLQSGNCGWAPKVKTSGEYLQIDLGKLFWVCAVATQGEGGCDRNEWTTKYKISLSLDNSTWNIYQWNGSHKIFDGNTDCCTVVKNVLPEPTKARYIRFIPTDYKNPAHYDRFPVLRVDVLGRNV